MDVAISDLRAGLRGWVERVRLGEDVVVTERGVPVARLVTVEAGNILERLEREGVITAATAARPRAQLTRRVQAQGSVSDLVTDLRR